MHSSHRGEPPQFATTEFLLLDQCRHDSIEEISIVANTGESDLVGIAQEGVDLCLLPGRRLCRPQKAPAFTQARLADDKDCKSSGHGQIAAVIWSSRASADIIGTEHDLLGRPPRQHRLQVLEHRPTCHDLRFAWQ